MHFMDKKTILVQVNKVDLNGAKSFDAVRGTVIHYVGTKHFVIPNVNNQVYFMPARAIKINHPSFFESEPYANVYFFIKKSKHNIIAIFTKSFKHHKIIND